MTLFHSFQRTFGKHIPENLTYYFLIGQIIAYIISYADPSYRALFPLRGQLVYAGEWWRLILFVFTPASDSIIWVAFTWYLFYFFGTGLERRWGSLRYLVYLGIAYLGMIVYAFLFPGQTIVGGYMFLSVFLAFAHLYPDVQLMIFFILPVKVKWLGILAWIAVGSTLLFASVSSKILMLVSVSNFFLFFGDDLLRLLPTSKFRRGALTAHTQKGARNVCAVCKKYEMDYLDLDFRYCTDCDPITCYCADHLENHLHKKTRLVH